MNDPINVLIVEDEPLSINMLKTIFENISKTNATLDFKIKAVRDCDTAIIEIDKAVKGTPFDFVILDINIPPSSNKKFLSGEDIGVELISLFPNIKILVYTSHYENYRLNNILQSIKPNGILVKSDVDYQDFVNAVTSVIGDTPYYSKTVLKLVRSSFSNDFALDKKDRKLLFLLSQGTKNKHLPEFIGLSKSAIERRKRNLKEVFCLENEEDDFYLLEAAKENGFI